MIQYTYSLLITLRHETNWNCHRNVKFNKKSFPKILLGYFQLQVTENLNNCGLISSHNKILQVDSSRIISAIQ